MLKSYKIEPLMPDELAFLQKKLATEKKTFKTILFVSILLCIILPPIFTYLGTFSDRPLISTTLFYILTQIIVFIIFSILVISVYLKKIFYYQQDIKHQQKIVESTTITEKKEMKNNHTFHFYVNSLVKLSIEINENDYDTFSVNDEINIEYAQYSKEYFGYF